MGSVKRALVRRTYRMLVPPRMNTHPVVRSLALLAAAAALSCGGAFERYDGDADPYNGVLDNTYGIPALTGVQTTAQGALATPFMPNNVPTSSNRVQCAPAGSPAGTSFTSCYSPQIGFANGQTVSFFNAGSIRTISFGTVATFPVAQLCDSAGKNCVRDCDADGTNCAYPPSMTTQGPDGSGGWHADVFPHGCTPNTAFNPVVDNYPRTEQFPIANDLPLNNAAVSSTVRPPLGIVAVYGVTGASGTTCNDLKYAQSITDGKDGAKRSADPLSYQAWMVFDPVVPVLKTFPNGDSVDVGIFWFNGLQANYLASPTIPLNSHGNLLAMDGVLVATSTSFTATDPTASRRVILPYQPGDDGYSPLVRLHTFTSSNSQTGSSPYNAICPKGATCTDGGGKKYVKFTDAAAEASSAILIVASPQ